MNSENASNPQETTKTKNHVPTLMLTDENSGEACEITVKDEKGNDVDIRLDLEKQQARGGWNGKLEFVMTCIGYAVGLGNVWRFPYLCHKNGGGAFLIPYCLMLILLGLPLFFLEFAFGQFASLGPISVWNISPLFKGIGYAMVILSWILVVYYQIVVAHCLYFLCASFTSRLPWTDCDPSWSSPNCMDASRANFTNITNPKAPSEDYYFNEVLKLSSGLEEFGTPSWSLSLCLLTCWIICALAVIKGVQSLGKVSYFTGIFPYVMLTILLIRSVLLPGAKDGVLYYLTPDFSRLKDPQVWADAATQIFFSLGCCNGGLITMSSYNKFKNNCCRDAVIFAIINCATSVYAGFVIFSNLGFMALTKNTTVAAVATSELLYALLISCLDYLWSVLVVIIYSLYVIVLYQVIHLWLLHYVKQLLSVMYMVSWLKQFRRDIELMIDERPNWYWRICWLVFTPIICFLLIISIFIYSTEFKEGNYTYPQWALIFRQILAAIPVLTIIAWFLYKYCKEGGFVLMKEFLKPVHEWGPAEKEYRTEFISMIKSNESLHRSRIYDIGPGNASTTMAHALSNSQMQMNFNLGGSIVSGLAVATGVMDDTKFFQSKLKVAEKLTEAHTKEVIKRVASNADFAPLDTNLAIAASQTALAAASSAVILNTLQKQIPENSTQTLTSIKLPEQIERGDDDDDDDDNVNIVRIKQITPSNHNHDLNDHHQSATPHCLQQSQYQEENHEVHFDKLNKIQRLIDKVKNSI
ncbi:putative sodium/chloride dependent transporter [Schistosoma mansoni]|uniref:putative sodium/chloride dependent transporter n=1 Tax=Schistosoma mansoni TaxID=6183 RepID=UPI00022DC5BB|nr:putative sodium/chloride dependent transporter [Schistosoma mansoni]|eukprot:XP_018653832.1 putative sodium/chloride dependent transporter [Schistosoma mansoni]